MEVAENLKWKTSDIFPSDEAWEKEFAAIESEFSHYDFSAYKGKLSDKQTLLKYFELSDNMSRRIELLYLYAHLTHDVDVRVSKYTSMNARVSAMISKIFAQLSFVEPELTSLDESVLQSFINDPDFKDYD